MSKQFGKIKRHVWLGAILRAVCMGIFLALLSLAAQWVYVKLTLTVIPAPQDIILIASPAVLGALVVLLVFLPRNKRLAARMDERWQLGEKVQTMIALREDPSPMAALQRESAETAIEKRPRRRLYSVFTWVFVVLPLVGALAVFGALVMPARAVDEPAPEPPPAVWRMDDYTKQKLKDLVTYVRNSDMEEEPKEKVAGELEGLLISLGSVRKETVMQEFVLNTATRIHAIVSEHNTYDEMASALSSSPSASIRRLGAGIRTLKPLLINEQLLKIGDEIVTPAETANGTPDRAAVATGLADEIRTAAARAGLPETDPLREALLQIADALAALQADSTGEQIAEVITDARDTLDYVLAVPLENEMVETTTIERLMAIFGLEMPEELIKDNAYDPAEEEAYEPDDEEKDDISSVGGIGSGDVHYGSNDTIYDDVTGTYLTYGEVLARYYTAVMGQMDDGELPAELEDMIIAYFEYLHGAGKDDTTQNQSR